MGAILDDLDSRPGSATSLLRTVIGLYLRRLGGWASIAQLVTLMEALEVPPPRTRTAAQRLKNKGLLLPRAVDRASGYQLNPDAAPMLARGDRRIFTPRRMQSDGPWCLISFSLPEELRPARHQLRRRLHWIGAGMVSPALWICPDYLSQEVDAILAELGIREHVTLFRSERPRVAGELRDVVGEWWDLPSLEILHRDFIRGLAETPGEGPATGAVAFSRFIHGVDSWRVIPYLDPGLPSDLLPPDWPGGESARLFADLSTRYREASWRFVLDAAPGSQPPRMTEV